MKEYPSINMKLTGKRLKVLIKAAGIDVKTLQSYLHLSCPQPIYRWFRGQVLPSVDHLYALSRLLGIHMEELLVPRQSEAESYWREKTILRILTYYDRICDLSA